MIVNTKPAIERMLPRKVVDSDGCWVWPGAKSSKSGYGQIRAEKRGRLLMTHKVSYEHFVGPIPADHQVEHRCHTEDETCPGGLCKHRLCWNPDHLTVLTHAENSKLSTAPNMQTHRSGVCQRGHRIEGSNVLEWVRPTGTVRRACRTCRADAQRRWRHARKAG